MHSSGDEKSSMLIFYIHPIIFSLNVFISENRIYICTSKRFTSNRIKKMLKEEIIRGEFIEAAGHLFQQYGMQKTTMEDIAKALGKGKSTLYYYFANKDEIFEAVVLKEIDDVYTAVYRNVSEFKTVREKIASYALNSFSEIKKKPILYKLVCGELKGNLNNRMSTLREKWDIKEIGILKEILELGVKSGEFSRITNEDADVLAHILVSALRGIEIDLFIENKLPELEFQVDLLVGIIIRGLH